MKDDITYSYITGANGFIGSHLVKVLESNNKPVICVPHKEIMNTKLQSFDTFYFLSTYGNMYFHTDYKQILQANINDLIHILLEAKSCRFNSFVYISSSSVELPVQTIYSRAKKAAEEILLSFIDKYDLPICIIRPYSITGVGEQKEHLIPTLIRSCFTGEQVDFVPNPRHDYIDVEDIVSEIIKLSAIRAKRIFKLGNSFPVSNKGVLKLVEEITGKKANINIVNSLRSYDNDNWYSKEYISRDYDWIQRISLRDSIKAMVDDYVK